VDPAALKAAALAPGSYLQRVVVRDGARIDVLAVERIDSVEAQGDYVAFWCGEQSWLKQQTLQSLEGQPDPATFVRVHRSHLINLTRLQRLEVVTRDSKVAILTSGRRVPVSRVGQAALASALGEP
jgi:two-component system LytT family response regulator